ncbi:unnamed protein product, partial [Polarella glacialis]
RERERERERKRKRERFPFHCQQLRRQCSRHPFSLLVGVALTDSEHDERPTKEDLGRRKHISDFRHLGQGVRVLICGSKASEGEDVLSGNLCVWPGSHIDLRRPPGIRICDRNADIPSLLALGAPLAGYEGLGQESYPQSDALSAAAARGPGYFGRPVPLKLRAGDCVILHPHTAHAAAPRYIPVGIRAMAYFRLHPRAASDASKDDEDKADEETCAQVFFDLPAVADALGGPDTLWSSVLRAFMSGGRASLEN